MQQARSFFGNNADEDPEWADMWYLNRNMYNKDLPDMNVTGAWAQGYSGKGVSVTFLDDGLEYTHPDIKDNYDHMASYDINANDNDPIPRYDKTDENKWVELFLTTSFSRFPAKNDKVTKQRWVIE